MKPSADLPKIIEEIELRGMYNWLLHTLTDAFFRGQKAQIKDF